MPDKKFKYKAQDLDLEKYLYNLSQNVESWVNSKDWNSSQKEEFWKAYELYKDKLQAINDDGYSTLSINDRGSIIGPELTNTDTDDFYYDQTGSVIKGDDYNKLSDKKKQKYSTFEANRQVANYLNVIAKAYSEQASKETKKEESKVTDSFVQFFAKEKGLTNPNDYNYLLALDPLDSNNKRGFANRINLFNEILDRYVSTLPEEQRSKYLNLKTHLLQKGFDNEAKVKMLELGISSDFFDVYFNPYENIGMTEESYLTWLKNKQEKDKLDQEEAIQKEQLAIAQEKEKIKQAKWKEFYKEKNQFDDPIYFELSNYPFENQKYLDTFEENPSAKELFNVDKWNSDVLSLINTGDWSEVLPENPTLDDWVNYWINSSRTDKTLPRHILYRLLYNGTEDTYTNDSKNRIFRLKADDDIEKGKTLIWDTTDRKLYYVPISSVTSGLLELKNLFAKKNPDLFPLETPAYSKGGLIKKLQYGGFQEAYDRRKREKAVRAGSPTAVLEEQNRKLSEGFTGNDWVDIGALGADLASMVTSFFPGAGTVASGVLGVGSTLTQVGNDIHRDGFQWSDIWRGLGNLGLDAIGIIPGLGIAGKLGKHSKTITKLIPKMAAIFAAAGTIPNSGNIIEAFTKAVKSPSDLTVQDLEYMQQGIKILPMLSRRIARFKKTDYIPVSRAYPFERNFETEYRIFKGTDAQSLSKAKSVEQINDILKKYRLNDSKPVLKEDYTWWQNIWRSVGQDPKNFDVVFDSPQRIRKFNTKKGPIYTTKDTYEPIRDEFEITQRKKKKKVKSEKQGGQIDKLQKGGNTIRNTTSIANWFEHMFNTEAMAKYLNSINTTNYVHFNDLQSTWYDNKLRTKYQPGQSNVAYDDKVKTRQKYFNETGLNQNIANAIQNKYLNTFGNSGDNASNGWQDGYFGEQEYLRHFGTIDSWKNQDTKLQEVKKMFSEKGLEYYPDENGMYLLRPKQRRSLQETWDWLYQLKNNVSLKPQDLMGKTDPLEENSNDQPFELLKQSYIERLLPYTMSLGRAVWADNVNRGMTDYAKSREKALILDPFTYNRYVQGNLPAINLGETEAAKLANIKTPYADATLNFATKLEAFNKGLDRIRQGRMIDNQASKQSYEQVWQQGKENALNEHETSLKNRLSNLQTEANKTKYELAYKAKQHEIWDTFGKEVEYDLKTFLKDKHAQQEIYNRRAIDSAIRYNLKKFMPELSDEALKIWDGVNLGSIQLDYDNAQQMQLYTQAQQAYTAAMYNALGQYGNLKTYPLYYKSPWSPTLKDGGKIKERIANAERLFKTIKSDLDRNEKKLDRLFKSLYTLKNKVK